MTAPYSSYTRLIYEATFRGKHNWNAVPKLEDLPKGYKLVQSFSEGRLHRSLSLIFTQAEGRSFDEQFLGTALLGELLLSDVVYWLELPPEAFSTAFRLRAFVVGGEMPAFRKLEAAQGSYFRAFHQLPNAFFVASGRDASQHDAWLRDSSPCVRHQQRNAGATNLASGAMGMPIRISYDPIAREECLLDGESDPSTGCQNVVMLGQTVSAGSLQRILEIPRRHLVAPAKQDTAKGCLKSYLSLDSGALAKNFQRNTLQDLAATLQKLYSTVDQVQEALLTWGEIRGIMALLRRLYDILQLFRATNTKKKQWALPDNIRALSDETESITQQLTSGPLHLGRTVAHDNGPPIPFTEKSRPKATPDGAKTEAIMEQALSGKRDSGGQDSKNREGVESREQLLKRLWSDAEDSEEVTSRPSKKAEVLKVEHVENEMGWRLGLDAKVNQPRGLSVL